VKALGDGVGATANGGPDASRMNALTQEGLQQLLDAMAENMQRLAALEAEKLQLLAEIARLKGFNADLLQKISDGQLVERAQRGEIALLSAQRDNAVEKVSWLQDALARSVGPKPTARQKSHINTSNVPPTIIAAIIPTRRQ